MSFDQPAWLLLLPLALLPLVAKVRGALPNAWVALLPRDRASQTLQWLLRGAALLALVAVIVGIAGPYRPELQTVRPGF